ncbi:hypothetical protein ACPC54_05920 [Kitasatospora sp. NPDC094028]
MGERVAQQASAREPTRWAVARTSSSTISVPSASSSSGGASSARVVVVPN